MDMLKLVRADAVKYALYVVHDNQTFKHTNLLRTSIHMIEQRESCDLIMLPPSCATLIFVFL